MPPKKGLFIVIEGLDGAGKGTMLSLMSDYLFNNFKEFDKILVTREPTYSATGQRIRKLLSGHRSPMTDAKELLRLYLEDRKDHLDKYIRPMLSKGAIILCDRYKHSTLAYQQTQGIPLEKIIKAHNNLLVPDLTLILDVEPAVALQRIKVDRSGVEKFEKDFFLEELRENYLKLKKQLPNENIVTIDANPPKEEVFDQIKIELDKLIKSR